ncbi:E3 ubiquitin-protein ligase ZSWIM2-like [Corticium candelabrum]|uniref:E3 ubiquitin-protein ligase ZSWIM2-like n=1 Tax=Corticium candelabrum TaxID=121492 RepID=UPI002E26D56A|nr:E3 ubiquitin-protein ligase ZSWIM2-like [Corticium candelabrum]
MSRVFSWRRVCPEKVQSRIEEALQSRIYLLNQTGPTGFILRQEGAATKYRVVLGDAHSCSCSTFRQEKELCVHILWVILKKFRVSQDNPIVFQLSLVEREINELVYQHTRISANAPNDSRPKAADSHHKPKVAMQQKDISVEDVCPVCYDELLASAEAITYCSHSCGKSVHVRCMKMWAEHQASTGATSIKCPLCREDFGPIETLRAEARRFSQLRVPEERRDVHINVACEHCNVSPIVGKCYRCSVCSWYHLCSTCFHQQIRVHAEHNFVYKQKRLSCWQPARRGGGQRLPSALLSDIQSRELTADDYDLLNQLDNSVVEPLPRHVVESFPIEKLKPSHPLLSPGVQCRVCLMPFKALQHVRVLPCRHRFHVSCIDRWLVNERATCPVDGLTVPCVILTRKKRSVSKRQQLQESQPCSHKDRESMLPSIMGRRCSISLDSSFSPASDRNTTLQRLPCERHKQMLKRHAMPPSIPSRQQACLPSLLVTNGISEISEVISPLREQRLETHFRLRPMGARPLQSARPFQSPIARSSTARHAVRFRCVRFGQQQIT